MEFWEKRWIDNRTGWHNTKVNEYLTKYYKLVTGKELPSESVNPDSPEFKENSKKVWFIPLCGKTLDIPFLLSLGYQVFAVEGVRKAIETLDSESKLGLQFEGSQSLFVGSNGRLKIYLGDLFKCPIQDFGPFDFIFDRGSFIAIEYPLRDIYKKVMQKALQNSDGTYYKFSYLLECVTYDKSKYPGPPRSVDDKDMEEFFEDWTLVRFLERGPSPEGFSVCKVLGSGEVTQAGYLLSPKNC